MSGAIPHLGQMIRCLRMGYGWTGRFFVRIIGADAPFRIDVMPVDGKSEKTKELFRVWWENGRECRRCNPSIIDGINPLRKVTRVKNQFTFFIDEEGNLFQTTRQSRQ